MTDFFQFESDFTTSLRCIPMQVRCKLDSCGVKLKLQHWHQFSADERQELVQRTCQTPADGAAYRQYLQALVVQHTGEPAPELAVDPEPPWLDAGRVPDTVQAKATECGLKLTSSQWATLEPLQRFALLKLSRPSHENHNFLPALREFGLLPVDAMESH